MTKFTVSRILWAYLLGISTGMFALHLVQKNQPFMLPYLAAAGAICGAWTLLLSEPERAQ